MTGRSAIDAVVKLTRPRKLNAPRFLPTLFMVFLAVLFVIPLYWLVVTSFRPADRIFADASQLIPTSVTIDNFVALFRDAPFVRWFSNSFILTAGSTLGSLVVVTMAAYPLSRLQFPFRNTIFVTVLVTYLLPFHLLLIPLFILMIDLGLIDTHLGVILPLWAHPFGLFFMRQYMLSIPQELLDAARVDGASEYGVFFRVIVPLVKPALATLAILFSLEAWNDLLWPLVVMRSPENFPLTLGIGSLLGGASFRPQWHLIMTASLLATLPIVVVFVMLRKSFIGGFARLGTGGKE
ncbi:MAG TPA: carbohydrate ABC transporter permease [Acidimicrobiia bacterium]|nr:carbohydrate ABC transporter permease [Acidimicrobiia bacterium]